MAIFKNTLSDTFGNHSVDCIDGQYSVITSCKSESGYSDPSSLTKDEQEKQEFLHSLSMIVSDSWTGFHYVNYTIFTCNREVSSKPLFWKAVFDYRGRGKEVKAVVEQRYLTATPPKNVEPRWCKYFSMTCGLFCEVAEVPFASFTLCDNVQNLTESLFVNSSGLMKDENIKNWSLNKIVFGYGGYYSGICSYRGVASNKDNLRFALTVSIKSGFMLTASSKTNVWSNVDCYKKFDKNCHVRNCQQDTYQYKIGQNCVSLETLNVTFVYGESQNIDSGAVVKFVENAWARLKGYFTYRLELVEGGVIDGNYSVLVKTEVIDNMVSDEKNYLPFSTAIFDEMKHNISSGGDAVPLKIFVCASMANNLHRQFHIQVGGYNSTLEGLIVSSFYCDTILPRQSLDRVEWLIESSYVKDDKWEFDTVADKEPEKNSSPESSFNDLPNLPFNVGIIWCVKVIWGLIQSQNRISNEST